MSYNIVSSAGSVRSLIKSVILLASFTTLVCTQACRENKLAVPPFTIDSLMTYSAEGLLTLVDARVLKDSVARNQQGVRTWYTVLMPGTAMEARICWVDSTRLQMEEVTVQAKRGQPNLWVSRDSIRTGLSVSDVQRINGALFIVEPDGSASSWSPFGRGALAEHIASVSFDADSSRVYSVVSSSSMLPRDLQVWSFSVTRWMLPSQITVIGKPITDPKRTVTNYVPQVVNRHGSPRIDADSINAEILKWFALKSYDSIAPDFSWSGIAFTWEEANGRLALDISGNHHPGDADPSHVHETLYFRTSGEFLTIGKAPFFAFLNYDQFFPFFKKYGVAACSAELAKAVQCLGVETTGDCYDNIDLWGIDDKVHLTLDVEACFPYDPRACTPGHTMALTWDDLQPFLNDFGKKHVRQYAGQGLLDKMDIAETYKSDGQPAMIFLKLKNFDSVAFRELPDTFFGLQLNPDGTVSGYTDEDEFQGQRPEYIGYYEGPTRFSGTYNYDGLKISIPWKETEPEELSFTWRRADERTGVRTLHVEDPDGRVTFMKYTRNTWIISMLLSEEDEDPHKYDDASVDEMLDN